MSESLPVLIDFSEAELGFDSADLENWLLSIAHEMQAGDLVQSAHLVRDQGIPDEAKSGAGAFLVGVLTAEINRANLAKLMDYLGNLRWGKTLTLSGEVDGMTFTIEYRNPQELNQALEAMEQLVSLRIKVSKSPSQP